MNLKAPKRIVTFCAALLLPLLSWQNASSQPPVYNPVQYANLALRTFFSTVTNPNPSISFLYDMSSHIVDSNYFGPFVTDTNFTENWYSLFEEMYNSAYDTNPLVRVSDVEFLASQQNITTNMIPMGIVDWDYNLLKADALSTGTYFDFDLINNIITDKPGASSAYTIENVFSCAPLEKYAYFSNPTFLIDPQYIFQDAYKVDSPPLEINFDDGSGWHAFDWHLSTTYVASYPSAGANTLSIGTLPLQASQGML